MTMASKPVPTSFNPAQLINDHQVGIWRYLRALGCETSEADDLTQETFLTVLQRPFEQRSQPSTVVYLRRVAYHRFISARRKSDREVAIAEIEEIDRTWAKLVGEGQGEELLDALRACLSQLSERARSALEMRFREQFTRSAIAEALSISEHGAKNLMQRAKQQLRVCIEGKYPS